MSSSSNVAVKVKKLSKNQVKVKSLAQKREDRAQDKEDHWARWWSARQGEGTVLNKNTGKPLVRAQQSKKGVYKERKFPNAKNQHTIKKAKNLEVEGKGTGNELEGKGNEDDDDSEHLGDEHPSDMTSDEDMQAEIEAHLAANKEGEGTLKEGETEQGTELEDEDSCLQRCSACGWKRPDRGIVECVACGTVN
jgi:hypothetical protein